MIEVSRHASLQKVRGYVRNVELFKDHAGAGLLCRCSAEKLAMRAEARQGQYIVANLAIDQQ